MAVFTVTSDTENAHVFVCKDDILNRDPNAVSREKVGRFILCSDTDTGPDTPEPPEYIKDDIKIYPNRVLHALASYADLQQLPETLGSDKTAYYRADTVAVLSRTMAVMNEVIECVVRDFNDHVSMLEGITPDVEMTTVSELTDDDMRNYFFQE